MYILKTLLLKLNRFPGTSGPVVFDLGFPVLENVKVKFQDFPGFPGPIQTLYLLDKSLSSDSAASLVDTLPLDSNVSIG